VSEWAGSSIVAFGVSFVVSLFVWVGAMVLLLSRLGIKKGSEEASNYHNESIYKDF